MGIGECACIFNYMLHVYCTVHARVHGHSELCKISPTHAHVSSSDIRCTGEDALGPYSPPHSSSTASDASGFSSPAPPPPPDVFFDLLDPLLDDESSLLWLCLLLLDFLTDDERERFCFPWEVSPPPPAWAGCWLLLREREDRWCLPLWVVELDVSSGKLWYARGGVLLAYVISSHLITSILAPLPLSSSLLPPPLSLPPSSPLSLSLPPSLPPSQTHIYPTCCRIRW